MPDGEEAILEEALKNLREAAQRIRAVSNRLRATGMREDPNHDDLVLSVALACWAGERFLRKPKLATVYSF